MFRLNSNTFGSIVLKNYHTKIFKLQIRNYISLENYGRSYARFQRCQIHIPDNSWHPPETVKFCMVLWGMKVLISHLLVLMILLVTLSFLLDY